MTTHHRDDSVFIPAAGAVAGDVTATGILVTDKLRFVLDLTNSVDYTSEFTITAADTINNTGGTSTAAALLLVIVERPDARGYTGTERDPSS